jgi:hypothetical protein
MHFSERKALTPIWGAFSCAGSGIRFTFSPVCGKIAKKEVGKWNRIPAISHWRGRNLKPFTGKSSGSSDREPVRNPENGK